VCFLQHIIGKTNLNRQSEYITERCW
jgi:hypothetical protein